jgi:transposase
MVVNAKHYKQVEGQKTDAKDCAWRAELLQHGLLRPSFVPPSQQRQLRDLTRQRTKLTQQRASVVNRIQKVLEDANIKLGSVASDVLGKSGRRMLEALIAGEDDPVKLADLALGRLRDKIPQLEQALRGVVLEHHRFLLRLHLDELDGLDRLIDRINDRITETTCPPQPPQPPGPDKPWISSGSATGEEQAPSCSAAEGTVEGPARAEPKPEAVEQVMASASGANSNSESPSEVAKEPLPMWMALSLLMTIPGIKRTTAEIVLAEIGADMEVFKDPGRLASWAGLCPGNHESAGKRYSGRMRQGNQWLKRVLTQAAWAASRRRRGMLPAQYKNWIRRLGKKRAVMATAHRLLELCFVVLDRRTPYVEPVATKAAA